MHPLPLTDELRSTFDDIDRLAERHQAALEYAAAHDRTMFLHAQMLRLHEALTELRAAGDLLHAVGDPSGAQLWRQTCVELRARAPTDLPAPGKAIVAGGLDLLQMVDYTGASAALAADRRDRLVVQIAQHVAMRQRAVASAKRSEMNSAETISHVRQVVTRLAEARGACSADEVAREQGWLR